MGVFMKASNILNRLLPALLIIVLCCIPLKHASAELVHIELKGSYWVDTDTIRYGKENNYDVITVKVYYGMNKSRMFDYRFLDGCENGWWCKNPGDPDNWAYVKRGTSDLEILRVILGD